MNIKIKNFLVIGILLILFLQIGIVLGDLNEGLVLDEGVEPPISEEKGVEKNPFDSNRLDFTGNGLAEGEIVSIKIGEDEFENIVPGDNSFITLGTNGEIAEANFTANENGGEYTINGIKFKLPANSHVYYDKEKGILELPLGAEISEIKGEGRLSGKEIVLPSGNILNGNLNFKDGKFFLKKGEEVVIDNSKITSSENNVNIYFEEDFDSDKHANENYYYSSDKERILHSIESGKVEAEILPGDEFFNLNKKDYKKDENGNIVKFEEGDEEKGWTKDEYGFGYKIVPDEKDLLIFSVSNGDELKAKERIEKGGFFIGEEKKLIPLIEHKKGKSGETKIQSGRITFTLGEKIFLDTKTFKFGTKELIEMHKGKYQSVPFQLKSDSILNGKDYQLRVGSNNQFAFISPEETDAKLVYNKYGIGIGQYKEDLQTIEQLNAKYNQRGINFNLSPIESESLFSIGTTLRSPEYLEPSPYMVKLVDQWLEEHPEAKIENIDFSDIASSTFYMKNTITLGEESLNTFSDFYKGYLFNDRKKELSNPLNTITHEYEHYMDADLNHLKLEQTKQAIEIMEDDKFPLNKEAEEQAKKVIDDKEIISSEEYLSKIEEYKFDYIKGKIQHNPKTMIIQEFYNKIVGDMGERLKKDEEFKKRAEEFMKSIYGKEDWEKSDVFFNILVLDPTLFEKENKKTKEKVELFIEYFNEISGLPATYALKKNVKGDYIELSTTYREEPIEERKYKLHQGTPAQKEVYYQLTQLAFDSGKMSIKEYKGLMGENYCKKPNCCDKKCILYQLNCKGTCK